MKGNIRTLVAMSIALLASGFALLPSRHASAASSGTRWGPDYFPNVPLITQDGKTVHLYDDLLKDKIVAVDLIYTHCKYSCPLETARLAQAQKLLGDRVGKDIFFYSITLDPKRDTPEVLKAYAQKFHAGPGWLFLTGKEADIKLVARKLGLYFDVPSATRDGHTPDLMLGNVATGQWMRNSAVENPRFLATTIRNFVDSYQNRERGRSYAEARELRLTGGAYLFSTKCVACHTIGHGDRTGPDLRGVTRVRDRQWLERFLAAPDRILAEGDPIARQLYDKYKQVNMPNLALGPADVAALIDYLKAQSEASTSTAPRPTAPGPTASAGAP
jgi:protein SCO1